MTKNTFLGSPLVQHPRPWWLPVLSLSITLYGILALHWDLQPIIFMFWWEVILIVAAALLRMVFALDGRSFRENIGMKIFLLIGGTVMGCALIMLSVTFTFKAFKEGGDLSGLGDIADETRIMTAGYVLGLVIHYFGNGRFRTANPMAELMRSFVHLVALLALLQAFTMHLIPRYPHLNQAMWIAITLVLLKFMIDLLFARVGTPLRKALETQET